MYAKNNNNMTRSLLNILKIKKIKIILQKLNI